MYSISFLSLHHQEPSSFPQALGPSLPCPLLSLGPEQALAPALVAGLAGRASSAPWPTGMGGSRPQPGLAAGAQHCFLMVLLPARGACCHPLPGLWFPAQLAVA